jgi:hypothetical protein
MGEEDSGISGTSTGRGPDALDVVQRHPVDGPRGTGLPSERPETAVSAKCLLGGLTVPGPVSRPVSRPVADPCIHGCNQGGPGATIEVMGLILIMNGSMSIRRHEETRS